MSISGSALCDVTVCRTLSELFFFFFLFSFFLFFSFSYFYLFLFFTFFILPFSFSFPASFFFPFFFSLFFFFPFSFFPKSSQSSPSLCFFSRFRGCGGEGLQPNSDSSAYQQCNVPDHWQSIFTLQSSPTVIQQQRAFSNGNAQRESHGYGFILWQGGCT